jgi:hypothetical protein
MSENDLWNMLSREDQELNGRAWSREMAAAAGVMQCASRSDPAVTVKPETDCGSGRPVKRGANCETFYARRHSAADREEGSE